jgi:hypothetical protein
VVSRPVSSNSEDVSLVAAPSGGSEKLIVNSKVNGMQLRRIGTEVVGEYFCLVR